MADAKVGVIGGSALYDMEGLQTIDELSLDTPFGRPSDLIRVGKLSGSTIAFLPRHGRGHRITPTEVNSRANIFALKSIGVEQILSVSAVGSMREDVRPLDLLVPDQLLDRTRLRPSTFFGEGIVAHVGFADPFCARLSATLADEAEKSVPRVHRGGTYVCIEGPQFSTKGRIASLSPMGSRRDRNDRVARGQARPRGRDLLRHSRPRDRLRCLAREFRARSQSKWSYRTFFKTSPRPSVSSPA